MFFIGTDFVETGGTWSTNIKSDGAGRVMCQVYATSGMTAKRLFHVDIQYTTSNNGWFQPLAATGSTRGLAGIASDAIASGCVGWVTVRGPVANASSPATNEFTGSIGHAVSFIATATGALGGLAASSSAYSGLVHQVGVLTEEATATLAVNIALTGRVFAQSL